MKPLAAIYCRISHEDQSEFSLPSQQAACEKLAGTKGFRTAAEYTFIDNGGLSTELDRPGLEALRAAVRSGVVGAVIIHDLDRLARKVGHQSIVLDEFEEHGVAVEFVSGPIEATPEGRMYLTIRGGFSEYERAKIKERTSRGLRQRALAGKAIATGYGYRMNADGKLVIDDECATIVRRIFDLTIAGQSASSVASALNADGVVSPSGGKWTRGSISALLRRPAYIGEVHFAKTKKCEPKQRRKPARAGKSKATSSKPTPRDQWITIPCPPILDRGVWDRAQQAIDRIRVGRSGRPSVAYLLRNLLRCKCGAALTGCESHGWHYYRCVGSNAFEKRRYCGQRGVRVEAIEPLVWQTVVDALTSPARLRDLYTDHHTQLAEKAEDHEAERLTLEARIKKLVKREARAQQAMLDVDLADSFAAFRDDLKATLAEKRQLQARLDALRPAAASVSKTDFATLCDAMQGAGCLTSREQRREFLQAVLSEIRVDGAELKIVFALNFEAAIATLGSQPVGPGGSGNGMARNCISPQRRQIARPDHSRRQTQILPQPSRPPRCRAGNARPHSRPRRRIASALRRSRDLAP
jgi:site-specific DNA recombinase